MKTIQSETIINSKPENVWKKLTDFDKYPDWNPFIKSISGDHTVGGHLKTKIHPPDSNEMTFSPTVLKFDQNKEFRWRGKLLLNGIFDGEHYFTLQDNNNGTTTFIQGENFSGILVGLFKKVIKKTKDGFQLMNDALKKECEQ